MTAIGDFRHRLALQAADEIEDGAGGVTRSWVTLGQVWSAIEPLSLGDRLSSDKRLGLLTHRILLRHRTDVTLSHRFVLGSRIFSIRAVRDPDERERLLECPLRQQLCVPRSMAR
ncbi:MAG: phage head closure protein [Rhizobiales bacterium]|nr:phage head closure protein [Hyphomicrobiales bacterium]